jgi:hypothetical protein
VWKATSVDRDSRSGRSGGALWLRDMTQYYMLSFIEISIISTCANSPALAAWWKQQGSSTFAPSGASGGGSDGRYRSGGSRSRSTGARTETGSNPTTIATTGTTVTTTTTTRSTKSLLAKLGDAIGGPARKSRGGRRQQTKRRSSSLTTAVALTAVRSPSQAMHMSAQKKAGFHAMESSRSLDEAEQQHQRDQLTDGDKGHGEV